MNEPNVIKPSGNLIMNLFSLMRVMWLGLLVLYLPACAGSALIPLAYTNMAIAGATGVASIPMQMHAMSQGEDMRRRVEENMQSQKARDEERLAMERERHQAWREKKTLEPLQSQVLVNPDTGDTINMSGYGSEIARKNKIESCKQMGFVEIDKLPSVGIKLPKYDNAENGITLEGVYPGSPAAKAGLKPDDRIVEKNGQPVKTLGELNSQRRPQMGDIVEYKIIRGGRQMVVSMKTVPLADILKAE